MNEEATGQSNFPRYKIHIMLFYYRKLPKIRTYKYNPFKVLKQRTLRYIALPNISPSGACTWKIAPNTKKNKAKTVVFFKLYKASTLDFETQICLRR